MGELRSGVEVPRIHENACSTLKVGSVWGCVLFSSMDAMMATGRIRRGVSEIRRAFSLYYVIETLAVEAKMRVTRG